MTTVSCHRVLLRLRLVALTAATSTVVGLWAAAPAAADSQHHRPTPTARAERAGVQPGNAPMGWRQQAAQRSVAGKARANAAPPATARTSTTPPPVLGIDVSSYQKDDVDWSDRVDDGYTFAFVKATEGTSYKNKYFSRQYGGAYDAGMIRGAYHFASPNGKKGYRQARYFVDHGGDWTTDGRTLPGVLDIEYNPYGSTCYGLSKSKMVSWIGSFTKEYKKLTGRDAIIYSTRDWWRRCTGDTKKFSDSNPLWIARYGTSSPGTLPGSWEDWAFWQYTSTPLDQDRFAGTRAELSTFATADDPDAPKG